MKKSEIGVLAGIVTIILCGVPLSAEADEDEKRRVRMPWLTLSVQGGYIHHGEVTLESDDDSKDVDSRNGYTAKLHLDLGGARLAWELAPFVIGEWSSGDELGKFFGAGAQTALVYRFSFGRVYPSIGAGMHFAMIGGDDIDRALEFYWRFPFGFTYYFARFVGLVVEVAPMFGWTGLETEGMGPFSKDIHFGGGSAVEVNLGLRFP